NAVACDRSPVRCGQERCLWSGVLFTGARSLPAIRRFLFFGPSTKCALPLGRRDVDARDPSEEEQVPDEGLDVPTNSPRRGTPEAPGRGRPSHHQRKAPFAGCHLRLCDWRNFRVILCPRSSSSKATSRTSCNSLFYCMGTPHAWVDSSPSLKRT
ncbi:hypothetical protein ACLOJK_007262, partial [Asimina triloba]